MPKTDGKEIPGILGGTYLSEYDGKNEEKNQKEMKKA